MTRNKLLSHIQCAGLLATLSVISLPSRAQDAPAVPPAPSFAPAETYRLRVENARFGRIEMSADGGLHYTLIGRVQRPAVVTGLDKTAKTPGLTLRSGGFGLAFSVAANEVLKLLPRFPTEARKRRPPPPAEKSAVLTDLEREQGLFRDLLPPVNTPVRLQTDVGLQAFPDGYLPSEDDVFVFLVTLPLPAGSPLIPNADAFRQTLRARIEASGKTYAAEALARARAEKRPVVSGTLALRAKLPAGEPDPITAVTYSIDGDIVAAQNRPPYTYAWDTRQVPDGEHVVGIRALDSRAALVTRVRALVVVENKSKTGS